MSRFCRASDLFGVILLLLSRAGEFIVQTIYVDGGDLIRIHKLNSK